MNKNLKQLSISEIKKIISEEIDSYEKQWSKHLPDGDDEGFDAIEFFGDAGDAAEADIRDEYGDDEFASFGSLEDPNMIKDLEKGDEIGKSALFKAEDSKGNNIKINALVSNLKGNKKGRVMGFDDNKSGNLKVKVDWSWPTDMKFKAPEEMGMKHEYPNHLIIQGAKKEKEETPVEEGIGISFTIRNTGERGRNINESVNNSIKSLMETKVTKNILKNFIYEEAKRVSKRL